jgi:polyferredoxin
MQWLPPTLASPLADLVLALHVGIVVFVVFGQAAILVGGWRGWRWVRGFKLRVAHLSLMLVIALQAWLGWLCPLTVWERALRGHAGQQVYAESFVEHWLSRLIFFEAPWWAFVLAYSIFAALVAASWIWVPPRRVVPNASGR